MDTIINANDEETINALHTLAGELPLPIILQELSHCQSGDAWLQALDAALRHKAGPDDTPQPGENDGSPPAPS